MFDIARDHGIRLDDLYDRNLMVMGAQPAAGQSIYLRDKREQPPLPAIVATTDSIIVKKPAATVHIDPPKQYHLVARGDTLFSISKKYNLTVAQLKEMNKLHSTQIYVGEKLKVGK